MRSYFLEAARQGRNHFFRYVLALLAIAIATFAGAIFAVIRGLFYIGLVLNSPIEQFERIWENTPSLAFLLAGCVFVALGASILWVEETIHHRPSRGLLSVDGIIRLRRVIAAGTVWLGLRIAATLIALVIVRNAYTWAGTVREWVAILPFYAMWSLLTALSGLLLLGYLMRSVSLIVPYPLAVASVLSAIWSLLVLISADENALVYFISTYIQTFFVIFLILKDECIELALGLSVVDSLYGSMFIRDTEPNPTLPGLFTVDLDIFTSPLIVSLSVGIALIQIGIFYYWFRGRSHRLQRLL